MDEFLRFSGAVKWDSAVEIWLDERVPEFGAIARRWFELRHGADLDAAALSALIEAAFMDIKSRLEA